MDRGLTGRDLSDELDRAGVVRLAGALPEEKVRNARIAVIRQLETLGLWRDGRWRLNESGLAGQPGPGVKPSRDIGNRHPEIETLFDVEIIRTLVDDLLRGQAIDRQVYRRPQVLFSLPDADEWTLPTGWHTDTPRLASGERPGIQAFTFLEPVRPGGGGTLVVAGSHRLLNDGRALKPKDVGRLLRQEDFFRKLYAGHWDHAEAQDLPSCQLGGVPVHIVELVGNPGDVWITDLRVLHAAAPNAGERPRLMVTDRFLRADLMPEISAAYSWS